MPTRGYIRFRVETQLAGPLGNWTNITRDVNWPTGIQARRGIRGDSLSSRVADTGVMTFALINNYTNSAGLEGYYSPGHSNLRSGFDINIGIRLVVDIKSTGDEGGFFEPGFIDPGFIEESGGEATINFSKVLWVGWVDAIDPDPGINVIPRLSFITAFDYMDKLARQRLPSCDVARGIAEHDAFESVANSIDQKPTGLIIYPGQDVYEYAFDGTREEQTTAIAELQRIGDSSFATIYVDAAGRLVFESRNTKRAVFGNPLTPDLTITDADLRQTALMQVRDNRQEIKNRIQVTITPRETEGNPEVLFRLNRPVSFPSGTSSITGLFTDPDERGLRAGGVDLIDPVANTDYAFNSEIDGSGTDETLNVTVVAVYCGNAVEFDITNNTGARVYPVTPAGATLLQARGVKVVAKESLLVDEKNLTSIGSIGENPESVDMAYQSNIEVARTMGVWFKDTRAQETRKIEGIPLLLNPGNLERSIEYAGIEISSLLSVSETVSALDEQKEWVNALDIDVTALGEGWITPFTVPAFAGPFIEFAPDPDVRHLTTGGTWQGQQVYITGTANPEGDRLLTLLVNYGTNDSSLPPQPTSIVGCGVTWVEVDDVDFSPLSVNRGRITLYRGMVSAPLAGPITINFPSTIARCSWSLLEFDNVNTGGTHGSAAIVQSHAAANTSPFSTIPNTLAAFAKPENRPAQFVGTVPTKLFIPPTNWSLGGRIDGTPSIMSCYRPDAVDLNPITTIDDGVSKSAGIAIEIDKVAA